MSVTTSNMNATLSFSDVRDAAARIRPHVLNTSVMRCRRLDKELGADIYFKCENFQDMGAFKIRGACNAIFSLPEKAVAKGVATHSSGNHGAAVALAAKLRGIPATVVMPENSSTFKQRAVAEYGAKIIYCESTMAGRESALAAFVADSGATVVHPYNDLSVMAGQGTAAMELHTEVPNLNVVLVPVGGGGLLSGTAVATRYKQSACKVIGVEPSGADDAWQAFRSGRIEPLRHPDTIADGLRATIGPLPFTIIRKQVDDIVRVTEPSIIAAMRYIWERMKVLIEPSSAVVVAALLEHLVEVKGMQVGVILTGGNVDLDHLPW